MCNLKTHQFKRVTTQGNYMGHQKISTQNVLLISLFLIMVYETKCNLLTSKWELKSFIRKKINLIM